MVQANKIKQKEKKKKRRKKSSNNDVRFMQYLLGGDFLRNEQTMKSFPVLLYVAMLIVLYIANMYYAEKKVRQIEQLNSEMKELRYEYISTKSELMYESKQSQIARSLTETGIRESTVPPNKLIHKKEKK